jgi:hypothetical protein
MLAQIACFKDRSTCCALLGAFVALFGCGPGGATPMPEPPALGVVDSTKVAPVAGVVGGASFPRSVPFEGKAGAAPAGAIVRVMNLDSAAASATTTAAADGSFQLNLEVTPEDELRFQVISETERSEPSDMRVEAGAFSLTPVVRLDCITLKPGYVVRFASSSSEASLEVTNTCPTSVTLQNPRMRSDAAAFELATTLPLSVPSNASQSLQFELLRTENAVHEDVWFVDITLPNRSVRYPITLFGTR